jgi:hypothetical protein
MMFILLQRGQFAQSNVDTASNLSLTHLPLDLQMGCGTSKEQTVTVPDTKPAKPAPPPAPVVKPETTMDSKVS